MVALRARTWWLLALTVVLMALLSVQLPSADAVSSASSANTSISLTDLADDGPTSVVEVTVADRDELDELVATGVDLDHSVEQRDDGLVVNAVVTQSEAEALAEAGFQVGETVYSAAEAEERIEEREATIAAHRQANADFAAATAFPPEEGDVKVIRADYYTSGSNQILSVEAKWTQGQTSSATLLVERDSGPGTEIGSGGTQTISRFVDAGVYLYHRGAAQVSTRPEYIRVTSPTGDSHTVKVNDWLPFDEDDPEPPGYQKDFITSYLTPSELYDRIHQLAEEFPDLATIVELPYKTNGYRRHAQALLGTSNANRVGIDSLVYGHEGGNDISVELADPGAPDQPLSVATVGNLIRVNLATDASGAITSTAADVVAAINSHPGASARVFAYTYRGNAGDGVVAPTPPTQLTDGLSAPPSVSREPHPVYAIRIGTRQDRHKKTGVLAYAQEHAREWVPPLVAIETAERLLRNYAHDGRTKQLLNNLDIWIAPSINPDGGHYSFYDSNSQRKNMTNHCPLTGAADALARNSWGVDNNRNYTEYSLFDGYSGASANCTSGTYAGPSELSEPENKNLDWLASRPNIKFSMNLHSSGNYFMWSPGAYATPGRISAPRPTLAEESFFWGASSRILTAIKRHRNMAVTPARTGPIADVLYSAAGNSGDMLWYKYGIYAWNFEVGTSFQPNWTEAHNETMEFANGLVELMHVAYYYDKDRQRPSSWVVTYPGPTPDTVRVRFETSEPAAVFYTTDGSAPSTSSSLYSSAGVREGGEVLTLPKGTTLHFYAVDSAGNAEKGYDPSRGGRNYNRATVR